MARTKKCIYTPWLTPRPLAEAPGPPVGTILTVFGDIYPQNKGYAA
jgi:hypothetical protein